MKGLLFQIIFAVSALSLISQVAEAPLGFVIEESKKETIQLVFVGDIMLGRNVENLMNIRGKQYPFASTTQIFENTDAVIANLEGPIPDMHVPTENMEMSFSFPPYVPELLYNNGIQIVSLANNHVYDKGAGVFTETVRSLKNAGVNTFGHPVREDISYVTSHEINGVKFTLAGFNATYPTFDLDNALNTIRTAKERDADSVMIVFMHWGEEYQLISNDYQREIAKALHDAGAEVIIGAHPHVVQETDCADVNKCTVYSLGNFIFDQYWNKEVETGMAAYVTLSKGRVEEIEFREIAGGHSSPHLVPLH